MVDICEIAIIFGKGAHERYRCLQGTKGDRIKVKGDIMETESKSRFNYRTPYGNSENIKRNNLSCKQERHYWASKEERSNPGHNAGIWHASGQAIQ